MHGKCTFLKYPAFLAWFVNLVPTTTSTTETSGSTSATDSCKPRVCPAVDPLDHTVLLPNPADCSTFYSCSNGVPILMHCPGGLHFNAELDVCDWPRNVRCIPGKYGSVDSTLFLMIKCLVLQNTL